MDEAGEMGVMIDLGDLVNKSALIQLGVIGWNSKLYENMVLAWFGFF